MNNYFKISSKVIFGLSDFCFELDDISKEILLARKKKKNIAIIGNGGSNSMAEHFAAELSCTFENKNRKPFKALTFNNLSSITAWSNDFSYQTYYERMVKLYLEKSDILIIFSTSGGNSKNFRSSNLVLAAKAAKRKQIKIFSFLGKSGGKLKKLSNKSIVIKSNETCRIQEGHLAMLHYICTKIEK
tara:strand:- start:340 stop:900 length:561 start_codon:yes stop_codon:yes gene_type:complete